MSDQPETASKLSAAGFILNVVACAGLAWRWYESGDVGYLCGVVMCAFIMYLHWPKPGGR